MDKRSVMAMIVVAFLAFVFLIVTSYSQDDVTRVEDSAFKEKRMRPAVPFPHDEHNEQAEIEDCNVCHHVYEEGKLVEDESSEDSECSECHISEEDSYPISLVQAYHNRCKGCHLERKAGPVMCAECHRRN
jgi:hypothetical protein